MKILKRILITLLILIAIPLIMALFIKKDYHVKREITINKPVEEVFDYIKFLKNQDNFSVWAKMDPKMKKSYEGTDGTVGFVSKWNSTNENVGQGEQTIVKIAPGSKIDYKLHFIKPFDSESDAYMTTEKAGENQTKVSWGFDGVTPYPWNFMTLFFDMDKEVGKDFATGLENLKTILEKQ